MDHELQAWIDEQVRRAPSIPREQLQDLADALGIELGE